MIGVRTRQALQTVQGQLGLPAAQLDSVLEPGMVDQMAQQSGQDRGDVLANLSRLLPGLVDTATPGGQAESGQSFDAGSLLASLSGLLDGKRG
ncbi:Uncharacterized protein conserved in bacteria [Bordetella pertussis]|nr:Uncharacterized protein conserved in bacteria [Bordetella pertussis]